MRKYNLEKIIATSLIVFMYGYLGYLTYKLYGIEQDMDKLNCPSKQVINKNK